MKKIEGRSATYVEVFLRRRKWLWAKSFEQWPMTQPRKLSRWRGDGARTWETTWYSDWWWL